ncbi:MAG: SRPBCC domain-containing protein [Chitinophagaceae bacterium]|nr:SRPBCC domain-containing protein [Chitinophagaceae bacterium]
MSYAIKHLFHISAPREKVFEAINSITGLSNWWTKDTSGDAAPGGTIQFRFGAQGPDMKVTEVKPGEQLSWECIAGPQGWMGNTLTFSLDENDSKTRVRFAHEGFAAQDDSFASANFSWARYMESLRQYCQTGKGEGFGTDGYRK